MRTDDAPGAAVERALTRGLVGIAGALDRRPPTFADAVIAVDAHHGERVARRLERFASAPAGAFVWTRDADGLLHLGALAGPWHFDPEGLGFDLVHVRGCRWLRHPVADVEAPPGVLATFARGGRNWQRIHAPRTGSVSRELYTAGALSPPEPHAGAGTRP
ncbi:GAF domain-containing protein [Microbacterium sp. LRZ72]|uniref:GAF domain-containing protein n=1 Tax=Microbacterium sp. LRZ72 TaxID=2942481 RepID=UPI0029BD225C|nr:GAF domain-containing protein [Microbacterium sp. LRZ72]MDX2376702.1 GAF domain-containing protein [Microbacterium sp. LRZ72]